MRHPQGLPGEAKDLRGISLVMYGRRVRMTACRFFRCRGVRPGSRRVKQEAARLPFLSAGDGVNVFGAAKRHGRGARPFARSSASVQLFVLCICADSYGFLSSQTFVFYITKDRAPKILPQLFFLSFERNYDIMTQYRKDMKMDTAEIPFNFLRHYSSYKTESFNYKTESFNLTEPARLCNISRTTSYK